MFEHKIALARARRLAETDATAAEDVPAIGVETQEPTPPRQRRRRVSSVLLIPAALILGVGIYSAGVVVGVTTGDLSVRTAVAAAHDLPAMMVTPPCNYDRVKSGCS